MKYEWKKCEKTIYGVKANPIFIQVPRQPFITIQGKGNPNHEDFANRVSALYAMAYGIKMDYKKMMQNNEEAQAILDYTVFPLEG